MARACLRNRRRRRVQVMARGKAGAPRAMEPRRMPHGSQRAAMRWTRSSSGRSRSRRRLEKS